MRVGYGWPQALMVTEMCTVVCGTKLKSCLGKQNGTIYALKWCPTKIVFGAEFGTLPSDLLRGERMLPRACHPNRQTISIVTSLRSALGSLLSWQPATRLPSPQGRPAWCHLVYDCIPLLCQSYRAPSVSSRHRGQWGTTGCHYLWYGIVYLFLDRIFYILSTHPSYHARFRLHGSWLLLIPCTNLAVLAMQIILGLFLSFPLYRRFARK